MSKERLEELLNEAACIYDAPDMAQVAEHLIKNNVVVLQRDAAQEQIDELESVLYEANHKKSVLDYRWLATAAYNAGYRKQSEGENISGYPSLFECSVCHWRDDDTYTGDTSEYNYCPNCGARMKGGAE